jgi:hypothetical protein
MMAPAQYLGVAASRPGAPADPSSYPVEASF